VWSLYQNEIKKRLHGRTARIVSPETAQHANNVPLDEYERQLRRAALLQAGPHLQNDLTTEESFTGGVPKTVKGGKRYWREAFVQLMAMSVEYGTPQFFLTLTANEMGWNDLRHACGGYSHGSRPVEATRHYQHRWTQFKSTYLAKGRSPIGNITHLWYRHEEQARASLHVHAAIWVANGTENPSAIRATVPRGPYGPADPTRGLDDDELQWRQFVLGVQMHQCQDGCHYRHGEFVSDTFCKSGYPHEIWSEAELAVRVDASGNVIDPDREPNRYREGSPLRLRKNEEEDRYEYRIECEEDARISPYIPEWLLVWGANMNIQYCTSGGFLSYISKYVCKPEPSGLVPDTDSLRERQNRRQTRFLNARLVGAPEAIAHLLGYVLKEGEAVLFLCTQPPSSRRRALRPTARLADHDGDAGDGGDGGIGDGNDGDNGATETNLMRFYDGHIEK